MRIYYLSTVASNGDGFMSLLMFFCCNLHDLTTAIKLYVVWFGFTEQRRLFQMLSLDSHVFTDDLFTQNVSYTVKKIYNVVYCFQSETLEINEIHN